MGLGHSISQTPQHITPITPITPMPKTKAPKLPRTRKKQPDLPAMDGPGVATADTLYWGFGLEGVAGRATRAQLMGDAMRYFRVQ